MAWTPDGRDLVYAVAEPAGIGQSLFRIPAIGHRVERGVRALHVGGVNPSVSRPEPGRSARLAFSFPREDVGLRWVDLQPPTSGVFRDAGPFCDSSRVDYPGPRSRDGMRVAFASNRSGWRNVWVANRDGSELRQVTSLEAVELLFGGRSPDDRRMVIDASVDGNSDLYVVTVDSGHAVRLTTEPSMDALPQWSADSRAIYFTSDRSGRFKIWKVPADGGEAAQVTRAGGFEPREAPDGRTLFYLDRPPPGVTGSRPLKQVSVDGGNERVLLDSVPFGRWSVPSQGILFATAGPEFDAIDLYSFSDRRVQRLGALPFPLSRIAGYGALVASRDARWALASVTDHWASDIMVADGFR